MTALFSSRRLRRLVLAAVGAVGIAWGTLEVGIILVQLPPDLLAPPASPVTVVDRNGKLLQAENHRFAGIGLADVSSAMVTATIGVEDKRFWTHAGVDWVAYLRAARDSIIAGRIVSGGSTITQQLIKLARPSFARSPSTKLTEALLALKLERCWDKNRILEEYLNRLPYGKGTIGVELAARTNFGIPAKGLAMDQALFLAGLPQSPSRFDPRLHPDAARGRYLRNVASLPHLGAASEPPPLTGPSPGASEPPAPHFCRVVMARNATASGRLSTTLDLDLQQSVQAALERRVKKLSDRRVRNAAAVVMDHATGEINAWCGTADWSGDGGQIDGVLYHRSSGSVLKPLLYLQAIDKKLITAASILPDTPDAALSCYPDFDPRNYDKRFWGPVRAREALASSLNVPAVVLLHRVGAREAFSFMQQSGIQFGHDFDQYGAGFILGNAEIRLLDITAVFTAFAHGGVAVMPRFTPGEPQRHHAISSAAAATIVADILCDDLARRRTFGANSPLSFSSLRVPCKTGTSSGFRDGWTVGLTGRHCVGVWMGNLDGSSMDAVASVTGPAPLWREIVDLLLPQDGGLPASTTTAHLTTRKVCKLSGLLPAVPGEETLDELFLPGTEPTETNAHFFSTEHGKRVVQLPAEYALWCSSRHNYSGATIRAGGPPMILVPRNNAIYTLDESLPREKQQLEFQLAGANLDARWEVNGSPVTSFAGRVLWPIQLGTYEVSVVTAEGTSRASFTVQR